MYVSKKKNACRIIQTAETMEDCQFEFVASSYVSRSTIRLYVSSGAKEMRKTNNLMAKVMSELVEDDQDESDTACSMIKVLG